MRFSWWILPILLASVAGCQPSAAPVSVPAASSQADGWQVRYNAVLSLARRGSPHVQEPEIWDLLLEMLDEERQLQNFRRPLADGREAADENAARLTVIGTLRAVQELRRKQPQMDLSGLREPIEKLTHSSAAPVRTEAQQTLLVLRSPT